ncbi:LmbE family N-acetylglucosaminyl deacetylase [Nonomuraea thailandensis]|uniref:LmbE family N-acetylglucosaminyl deacetylase n=1 Tax=Nonomuraea thailandensis TaxID=1188745 RepID=A0A9X2G9L7_9ACTN|nr:PIG-L family deacetylase [Nonomuraea thailandensis]MCP2353600.1 LmbE family N-acetylglucosaminyl deacetylase [Nonomuraea thailandensis]
MNVVCVFAHQDDEMRCLGTLLRLRDAGCRIVFVCITRGDKGLPFDPLADAVRVREREMLAVADAFAAEYVCLGREDGFAEDNASLRRDLIRTLRRMRAELIFTHWTADYNDDHVVTAKAVTDAALFAAIASVEPHVSPLPRAPRIFYTHPGDGYGFEATHFVRLSPVHHATKSELIRRHHSQMDVMRRMRGHDYADELAAEDRRQGARLMVDYAEAFRACLAERRIPWPSDLPGDLHEDH